MPALNHHIVAAHDKEATALFFSEILGLDDAFKLGEFAVLRVSRDTTLDFIDTDNGSTACTTPCWSPRPSSTRSSTGSSSAA